MADYAIDPDDEANAQSEPEGLEDTLHAFHNTQLERLLGAMTYE